MQKKRKSIPKTKPGAKKGNKNAEKHGFYSKQFTLDESNRLADSDLLSLESEIELINVFMDRLATLLPEQFTRQQLDNDLKSLNTLALMMQSKSTMIRTHYLTKGRGGLIEQTILEALEELRIEMGI